MHNSKTVSSRTSAWGAGIEITLSHCVCSAALSCLKKGTWIEIKHMSVKLAVVAPRMRCGDEIIISVYHRAWINCVNWIWTIFNRQCTSGPAYRWSSNLEISSNLRLLSLTAEASRWVRCTAKLNLYLYRTGRQIFGFHFFATLLLGCYFKYVLNCFRYPISWLLMPSMREQNELRDGHTSK